MMKYYIFTGIFLLFCFLNNGCTKAEAQWDHLYQIDPEESSTGEAEAENAQQTETAETVSQDSSPDTVTVYVCGAVTSPGVYELPAGARVHEAIEAAGGLTEEADLFLVNQARMLNDGEQIRIYTKEEAANVEMSVDETDSSGGKVDINSADMETLMTLPGIGEAKAASIVAYRQSNGAFSSIDEIKNIPGIKDAVFSKIKDKITV